MKPRWLLFPLAACFWTVSPMALAESPESSGVSAEHEAFFREQILPILQEHCYECHAGKHEKGGLRLDSRVALEAGGESGPVISMDQPETSVLLQAVRYDGYEMPPKGKLSDKKIGLIAKWVAMGAPFSSDMLGSAEDAPPKARGKVITDKDRAFWSFQPVRPVPPPVNRATGWSINAIDTFIEAGLRERNLQPNPAAAPQAALRRLHYDLTGLPPPLDLVEAFVADPSDAHWNRIVDRLLASPQYGERWGRHWMDLVRYAETNSYERDDAKPEAWRYRDWVIQSFNQDQPYDEFTKDQLAGDERAYDSDRLIATGFYRLGIWDDEPVDAEQARFDDLDDIITTTSQVFLGLTLNCARCHDHKIDPLTQRDYYQIAAFMAGIRRYGQRSHESVEAASIRPLLPPAEGESHQQAVQAYRQRRNQLEHLQREVEKRVKDDLNDVEKQEFRHRMNRVPILEKRVGKLLNEEQLRQYREAQDELEHLERSKPPELARALCVTEQGSDAGPMHVLIRGNPHAPGDAVVPGYPEVLGGFKPDIPPSSNPSTSGRRTVLANWITAPENPLTARVMANRLWHYHFGRGLVRTPNDFGYQGSRPTHPELLDWLATELVHDGWHVKPLHRLIVTSRAYRMSSGAREDAMAIDPLNDSFWRFDPRRLSAEEIRDSILAATGQLNYQMRGPWMYPRIEAEVLAGQSRPGSGWGQSPEREQSRRSVYIHIKRSLAVPLLAAFDAAEPDFTCPARFATTQPTQALGMLNGEYLQQMAQRLAEHSIRSAGADPAARIAAVLRPVLQREPTPSEIERGITLLQRLQQQHGHSADDALRRFGLVALNLNEFIYLD